MSWAKVNEERREGTIGKDKVKMPTLPPGGAAIGRRIAKGGR